MFKKIVKLVARETSGGRIMGDVTSLYAIDRWFTYPKFLESAEYVAGRLKSQGADNVQVVKFPADGKTFQGSWLTPLAWDAKEARLTVVEPEGMAGEVLADYEVLPCSLVMWSGPTKKGGVTAELVDVGAGTTEANYKKNVRGKIVFVNQRASAVKGMAAKHGAVGILTDWLTVPDKLPDAVFWNNSFADIPSQWGPGAKDSRLFAFGICPNRGRDLRALLAKRKKVVVHAKVDTRLYIGDMPVTTGCIKGRPGSEEVLVLGHGFEQGACDNASGIACMLEAMRVIGALLEQKKLPRPKRSIRMLMTNECFGTLGYFSRFPGLAAKTVAGLCVDSPGVDTKLRGCVEGLSRNPESNASYVDTFAERLAEEVWGGDPINPWCMKGYGMTDNLIAHPTIGIPTVWMGKTGRDVIWHTSADTPERLDSEQLAACAAYIASYLYFLADAGTKEAEWMAGHAASDARAALGREFLEASADIRRIKHLLLLKTNAVKGTLRLAAKEGRRRAANAVDDMISDIRSDAESYIRDLEGRAEKHAARREVKIRSKGKRRRSSLDRIIPIPKVLGPITYDPIPVRKRKGYSDPRWDTPVNEALGWMDGKRTLAEVVTLTENENGRPLPGLADEIKFLIRMGMVGG